MAHTILGAPIFLATLALIMIRPARLSEAVIAACGGLSSITRHTPSCCYA